MMSIRKLRPQFSRRGAALAAFCLGLLGLWPWPAHAQQNDAPPVTGIRVARQDVPEYVTGIGTVQAYRQVLVRARVDGELQTIAFHEGQDVHPGDLLAQIDPRPYAATLAQAQAKRASDQAQLNNGQRDLARYSALARTNVASRQQVDTQQSLVAQYEANLQGDEAQIASAALNLSFCRITAPIDGVVGLRLVDIGNLIHATDATGIVSITQVHPISLVFTLPQEQLPAVRAAIQAGTPPVAATTQDGATLLSKGVLVTINNQIDTQTGTIRLKAQFDNTDNKLWPGQFANGRLQLGTARAALTVATQAVQHGTDGLYVYAVQKDGTVAKRDIKIGYQDESTTIVAEGLTEGELVILSGQLRVQPGMKVALHLQGASK
jgi:multidrug efflux system membrane fusion protein